MVTIFLLVEVDGNVFPVNLLVEVDGNIFPVNPLEEDDGIVIPVNPPEEDVGIIFPVYLLVDEDNKRFVGTVGEVEQRHGGTV